MTADSPRPSGRWWRSILIAIGILVCACSGLSYFKQPTPEPQKVVSNLTATQNPGTPTAAEREWFNNNVLLPLQVVANKYPIASIRERVRSNLSWVQSKRVYMSVDREGHPAGDGVTAASFWAGDNSPRLVWFLPAVRSLSTTCQGRDALYVDTLVVVFLHEMYHLLAQGRYNAWARERQTLLDQELEAWWWTLENVIDPMRDHGRHLEFVSDQQQRVYDAYQAANGDPKSPSWRNIAEELVPQRP